MTNGEAVNWLINISADIGKAEHRDLWHYEQALSEIREMLESAQPERKKGKWIIEPYDLEHDIWAHRCGECLEVLMLGGNAIKFNFCPNCGAEMEKP